MSMKRVDDEQRDVVGDEAPAPSLPREEGKEAARRRLLQLGAAVPMALLLFDPRNAAADVSGGWGPD